MVPPSAVPNAALAAAMSVFDSKFVRSSEGSGAAAPALPVGLLSKVEYESRFAKPSDSDKPSDKEDDAAPIVRTVVDWVPDRLLCKRWNVPDPYVGLAMQPQPGHRKSRFERESVADLVGLPPGMALPTAAPPQPGVPVPGPEDTTPVAPMARPAADLFRSIFDPSSDEED